MKKVGDLTVNDGKGLMDNEGLCDSLLIDLNNISKHLMTGQYIQFCTLVVSMSQKLINLKKGITNDMQSMKDKLEEMKRMNDDLMQQISGLPVERNGDDNGGC